MKNIMQYVPGDWRNQVVQEARLRPGSGSVERLRDVWLGLLADNRTRLSAGGRQERVEVAYAEARAEITGFCAAEVDQALGLRWAPAFRAAGL